MTGAVDDAERDPVVAVVTGGGTSGHVLPAIGILESLRDAGVEPSRLAFVGTSLGADRTLVESSGLAGAGLLREYLPMSGLQRGLSWRSLRRNLPLPWRLAVSRVRAGRLLRAWKPRVVVSVGGHASEPMVRAALAEGVPVVCVSYDAVPGLATRRQAKHATSTAIAFEGIDLPRATVTGAPVRAEVLALADRLVDDPGSTVADLRRSFGLDGPEAATGHLVTVTGGSLGSATLNAAVPALLERLARDMPGRCTVVHVCGERNLGEHVPTAPDGVAYRRVGYEPRLAALCAASDVMVCRAGASTVAEIAVLGRPAVVVPWPDAADGHQERNARWLAASGGAIVVDDEAAAAGEIPGIIVGLLGDGELRRRIGEAARRLGAHARSGALRRVILEAAGLIRPAEVSLEGHKRIHIVGAAGPGMSALAHLLADMGHDVTGSDMVDNDAVRRLVHRGVKVSVGHDRDAVADKDIVVYSTGVPVDNIELRRARDLGCAVVHRADALAAACARTRAFGILGTHGKTTTASILASMLVDAGRDPGWLIGGDAPALGEVAHWSGSGPMIVEADESDGTHEILPLWGALLTNVDEDHLDRYPTMEALEASFVGVLERCGGPILLCADDPGCRRVWDRLSVGARPRVRWWGRDADGVPLSLIVGATSARESGIAFPVRISTRDASDVAANEPSTHLVSYPGHGDHNASNAAGALLAAVMLGVPPESAIESAGRFGGVARRLEHKGSAAGVDLYDDYAHVPGEIRATIAALRQRHPGRRIVAAFQPNRFHRVRDMHAGFGDCFDGATVVVIADIYASGTAPIPGVTGRLILDSVRAATAGNESVSAVLWAPGLDDVIATLSSELRPGDVCVGMGCGDIGTIAERLLSALADHDEQRESR